MKPRLVIIFLLIVLLPMALMLWLGVRVVRNEQEMLKQRFRDVLMGRLDDTTAVMQRLMEEREREMLRLTELRAFDAPSMRKIVRENPRVLQVFLLDPRGNRIHPPPDGPLCTSEREFLQRAGQVWKDKQVFYRQPEGSAPPSQPQAMPANAKPSLRSLQNKQTVPQQAQIIRAAPDQAYGWYTWYWGSGLNLIFWRRSPVGHVFGIELNRARLLADIIAELPDTDPADPKLPSGRIRMVNAKGEAIYQWGRYEPPKDMRPAAQVALSPPLGAWRLDYFAPPADSGGGLVLNLIAAGVVIGVALIILAVYFYRESAREIREAMQRVSFVSQVSHELKTPLTNIRMYAELLENEVPEDDEKAAQHLGIVVSESQRLSRLINNVLTFARKQRDKLTLRPSPGAVDDLVASVIESFTPALESRDVTVTFNSGAAETVRFDADAVEQILGNLFSNVEKYAAAGGAMDVASRQEGDTTTITVSDKGPGIPRDQREKVFDPFHRLSDKLTDGVAGTGIGLSLARDLARLHGGDLRLVPSEEGASFEVTLNTPRAEGEAD